MESMENGRVIGGLIVAAMVIGGIFLLVRSTTSTAAPALASGEGQLSSKPALLSSRPLTRGERHYTNTENWHVKWSPDGDECWVEIKRDAVQS